MIVMTKEEIEKFQKDLIDILNTLLESPGFKESSIEHKNKVLNDMVEMSKIKPYDFDMKIEISNYTDNEFYLNFLTSDEEVKVRTRLVYNGYDSSKDK